MSEKFIPPHGGYQKLLSYQRSEIIYDATVYFTKRFFKKGYRTIDQMVQAARSGKQNIAEASIASGTSKEMEIKLTNVARASQEELLIDYRDFLRSRQLIEWSKEHPYSKRVTELCKEGNNNYTAFQKGIEHENPEISSNVVICLIKLTNFLLDRQIQRLEQDFLKNGGLREQMTRARLALRAKRR
jgi:four helix bundle suffix protein